MLESIVDDITSVFSVKCATALLQGETGLKLDINAQHKLIDLLIWDVDFRFLNISIQHISKLPHFIGWSTRQSLYMTLVFCLENIRSHLRYFPVNNRLHFRSGTTNEAEKEIYRYVKDGKLIEIAALLTMSLRQLVLSEIVSLMASQITLVSTSEEVHDELNNKLETMMCMLRLIEVFERIGDKIELYLSKLSKEDLAVHMAWLLISEGFAEYKDFELKSYHPYLNDWTPKKSIFKLVCILCLPQLKESLERVRLAACKTEIETFGCDLARQGKLVELASLLMVAPEKLIIVTSPGNNDLRSNVIRQCIMSDLCASLDAEVRLSHELVEKCKDWKKMNLSALLVLEVFERASSSINQYLQSDAYNDGTRSRLEIIREIQNLLEKAGFAMKSKDADLNNIKWYDSWHSGHAVHRSYLTCFSPTLDPVNHTSLRLTLRSHECSIEEVSYNLCFFFPGSSTLATLFSPSVWVETISLELLDLSRLVLVSLVSAYDKVDNILYRFVFKKKHLFGTQQGSRPFHTVVQGNLKCFTPKSKAALNVSRRSIGWFLSIGLDITKFIKRV
ncbi:hypothetical protein V6N13_128514 [Hibiscus sabdariffa]